ncbi:unnamed protein product [Owenia fusiformis]|uniref:Uncharacterized protein n=1 Tax=Owenia fusiformis TaxID=6347 RepID=A0A8J1XV94_OWEFU|nr:unnamed protein product [Owenia fusiformis]
MATEVLYTPQDYPAAAAWSTIIFGSLVVICAIILNTINIICIASTKAFHTIPYMFLLLLSINDIIFCVWSGVFIIGADIARSWVFGDVLCQMYVTIQNTLIGFEMFLLMFLTFSRYFLVVHKKIYRKIFNKRCITGMLIFTWLFAIGWQLAAVFKIWGCFRYNPHKNLCSFYDVGDYFNLMSMIMTFIVPLMCILFCYIQIFRLVSHQKRQLKSHAVKEAELPTESSRLQNLQKEKHGKELKLTKTMVAIVIMYCLSYFPFMVLMIADKDVNYPVLYKIATVMIWSFSCWNTIVLIVMNEQFRQVCFQKIALLKCCEKHNTVEPFTNGTT